MRKSLLVLLVTSALGCTTTQVPTDALPLTPAEPSPIVLNSEMFANPSVELADNSEWWILDGYKPQLITSNWHGLFHDRICRPGVKIVATVAKPTPHPFIRENHEEAERERLRRQFAKNVRVVTFELAPVTLDELEKEFIASALPRAERLEFRTWTCSD